MLFTSLVLITGPLWAKPVWFIWWTWDARLTSTLILWLIYGAYYMLRLQLRDAVQRARLCAVVDVFDAMTCRRSYRNAMPVAKVLEHLENIAGGHLDKEMVRCWTSIMHKK